MAVPAHRYWLALLVPIALSAQTGRVERLKHGDTTIVRTTGDGLWGPLHDAVEVKRVGGESDALTFGFVIALVATPDGGVAFFDGKALEGQALRLLTADGRLKKTLGREGGGPGEFRGCGLDCLAVGADGIVAILDHGNGRIGRYRPEGTALDQIPTTAGAGHAPQILAGPEGSYFIRLWIRPYPNRRESTDEEDARAGYLHLGANGRPLDTIALPKFPMSSGPLQDRRPRQWIPLPDGRLAIGNTDRVTILLQQPRGGSAQLMIEHPVPPVPYGPDERKEILASRAWFRKQYGPASTPADPPAMKPAWWGMTPDNDGRIWLKRRVAAVKRDVEPPSKVAPILSEDGSPAPKPPKLTWAEPPVYAGFRTDGTFLGEVRFPLNTAHITFAGDFAWAVLTKDDGEELLVKYRIVPAGKRR